MKRQDKIKLKLEREVDQARRMVWALSALAAKGIKAMVEVVIGEGEGDEAEEVEVEEALAAEEVDMVKRKTILFANLASEINFTIDCTTILQFKQSRLFISSN